jgi:hypothetical protein
METSTIVLIGWNTLISVIMGLTAIVYKQNAEKVQLQAAEVQRLGILLNKTREEVARDNVTQAEIDKISDHIDQRFNKLEEKIDRLIQQRA